MNEGLNSKHLNRLIKGLSDPDIMTEIKNEQFLQMAMTRFLYRNSEKHAYESLFLKYVDYIIPAVVEIRDDFWEDQNPLCHMFMRQNIYCMEQGLLFQYKEDIGDDEEKLLNKVLTMDGEEAEKFRKRYGFQQVESFKQWAKYQLKLRKEGYHGKYPAVNRLLSGILRCDDWDNKKGSDIRVLHPSDYGYIWSYLQVDAFTAAWLEQKKIYRVSPVLEEDFIGQKDLRIPGDAVKYLPFRSFAIDLTNNPILGPHFDSVIVSVIHNHNETSIGYMVYDHNGLIANPGYSIVDVFAPGQESRIDEEELKFFVNDNIELYDCYKKSLKGILSKRDVFAKNEAELDGIPISNRFLAYEPVRASLYKKLRRFLFSFIFYLCCSNKHSRKTVAQLDAVTANKVPVKDIGKPAALEVSDTETVEIEDFGTDKPYFLFNTLDLDDDGEYIPAERNCGNKTGLRRRPHLVRGHYQHYRCGKGRKEVIYKYTEPYYTGRGHNVVSVTELR